MNLYKQQLYIETKYSKQNARKVTLMELEKSGFEIQYKLHEWLEQVEDWFNEDAGYDRMNQEKAEAIEYITAEALSDFFSEVMVLTLSTQSLLNIQAVLGQTLHILEMPDEIEFRYQMKIASELLVLMAQIDVLDIDIGEEEVENEEGDIELVHALWIRSVYELPDDVLAYIAQLQYLPPMLVKPFAPESNRNGGGYLSVRNPMVLNHSRNVHSMPMDKTAITILQKIPFCFDEHVLATQEQPNKVLDTLQKKKQFNILRQGSRNVYEEMQANSDKFYFHWRADKRGRLYSQGYHMTVQGTEYKKALIDFANKEIQE